MDKKLLIMLSICAVILLVLVSLSNVVGYQSLKSNAINDSPLFNIRAQKANNRDDKNQLSSEYLGKGKNNLLIPLSHEIAWFYQKVIERINRMDEASFSKFITIIIIQKDFEPSLKNINSQEITTTLYRLRNDRNLNFGEKTHETPLRSAQSTACVINCVLNLLFGLFNLLLLVYFTIKYHGDCMVTIIPNQCS